MTDLGHSKGPLGWSRPRRTSILSKKIYTLELELELIQTRYDTKPVLREEVGALGAHRVKKNMRGRAGQARMFKASVWVGVGIFVWPQRAN